MPAFEKRRYKRLSARWVTRIDAFPDSAGPVRNVSLGGVFVETPAPFLVGQLVEFEIQVPDYAERVRARGVVRWVEAGQEGRPPGMGVEFVGIDSGREAIRGYVQSAAAREQVDFLTRTPLHTMLLRFHCRKVGESFPIDVLGEVLGCPREAVLECLKDFALYRLVRFAGDRVSLVPAADALVGRAIQGWYEAIEHGSTPIGIRKK
jgi:uncharacterized protein (TIGR02266 family)